MLKKFLIVILIILSSMLAFALDDQGNPNDPRVNERANACYEDGSMAGKCDTDWEWQAGWYLIRFEYGLLSREQIPAQYRSVLPPLPQEEEAPEEEPINYPTAGCVKYSTTIFGNYYIDFKGGNVLDAVYELRSITIWEDASCTDEWVEAFGIIPIYAPNGIQDANVLCKRINKNFSAVDGTQPGITFYDIYFCGG